MKYLAIDYGQKRAGIAVSDAGGSMAFARTTLDAAPLEVFFRKLLNLIAEEAAESLVLGLPLNLEGEETKASARVRAFAAQLRQRTELPIFLINEALTSFAAEADLREAGVPPKKRAALLDQQAAVHILQTFLSTPTHKREQYEP